MLPENKKNNPKKTVLTIYCEAYEALKEALKDSEYLELSNNREVEHVYVAPVVLAAGDQGRTANELNNNGEATDEECRLEINRADHRLIEVMPESAAESALLTCHAPQVAATSSSLQNSDLVCCAQDVAVQTAVPSPLHHLSPVQQLRTSLKNPPQPSLPPAPNLPGTTVSRKTERQFYVMSLGRGAGRTLLAQLRYKMIILLLVTCFPQVLSVRASNRSGECSHNGLHSNHSLDLLAGDNSGGDDSHLFPFLLLLCCAAAVWYYIKIQNPLDGWEDLRVCVIANQPASLPPLPSNSCCVHHPPPKPPEFHHHDHDEDLPNFGDGDDGGFQSSFSPHPPSENFDSASPEIFQQKATLVLGRRFTLLHGEADQLLPGNLSSKLPENVVIPTHPSGKELPTTAEAVSLEEEEEEGDEAARCLHHQDKPSHEEEEEEEETIQPTQISKEGHLGTACISKVDAGNKHLDLFHIPNTPPDMSQIFVPPPPPPPPSEENLGASFLDENGLGVNCCMGGPPCFVMADEIELLPPLPPIPPSPPPDEEYGEFDCCFDHPVIKLFMTPSGPN